MEYLKKQKPTGHRYPGSIFRMISGCLLIGLMVGVSGCLLDYKLTGEKGEDTVSSTDDDEESDSLSGGDTGSETEEGNDSNGDTVGGGDSSEGFDSGSDSIQDTETLEDSELPLCPTGIGFSSKTVFTAPIEGDSTAEYEYHDSCDDGEVIVGFHGFFRQGTKNLTHGQIQALCARLSIVFENKSCLIKMGDTTELPLRGITGDVEWARMCPQNETIVGYEGKTGADIDQITFVCAPLYLSASKDGYTISQGPSSYLETAGGVGGNYEHADECQSGQLPTSTKMSANNVLVFSLGLGCQVPSFLR